LSFGITIKVSTEAFIFSRPSRAYQNLLFHSNENGLVTTPTVRIPISLAICAITGAAPVPVPHHIPAVTKIISASIRIDLISSRFSSADFLPTSGIAPAQSHFVRLSQMFTFLGARDHASACASVFTATNSTHSRPSSIILLTVLFPHPPTQMTFILAPAVSTGLNS